MNDRATYPQAITGTWSDVERRARYLYANADQLSDERDMAEAVLFLLGAERAAVLEGERRIAELEIDRDRWRGLAAKSIRSNPDKSPANQGVEAPSGFEPLFQSAEPKADR